MCVSVLALNSPVNRSAPAWQDQGPEPGAGSEEEHWLGDQSGHLDGLIDGLFLLLNLMEDHAWIGVYLNSGGYIRALKDLALAEFWRFKEEFSHYPRVDASGKAPCSGNGTLRDAMLGTNDQAKLRAAWNAYASFKLRHLEQQWKRVYVEIPEGTLLLRSMCTFHFGARFPLVFSKKPVPINLFHMRLRRLTCPLAAKPKAWLYIVLDSNLESKFFLGRLHMYFGSKLFRNPSADPQEGMIQDEAQESTIDIFSTDLDYDWLSPAQALARQAWGKQGV